MKKNVMMWCSLFIEVCFLVSVIDVLAETLFRQSTNSYNVANLSSWVYEHNWNTLSDRNYYGEVWKDNGLSAAYNIGVNRYDFKKLVEGISSSWTSSGKSFLRLYSLIGFSRSITVLHLKKGRFFNMISCDKISPELQKALAPYVISLQDRYSVTLREAQKFSLITAFEVSWNDAVSLMNHICPEGAFSHEYSVEEALFIIHMKAKSPSVFEKSFWSSTKYNDEQLLYAKCLVGALAKVLKIEGTISGDFGFSIGTNHDPKTLLFENAIRFLSAYAEGNPEFSKKPPAGVDIPVVYQ